jgi:hypothetical protein
MAEFVEKVRYEADISDLKRKLGEIEGATEAVGDTTQSTAGKAGRNYGSMAKSAGLWGVAIGATALAVGSKLLDQGASLDALGKKSATVFEGSLGSVQAWAKENASALGMTRDQLTGTAAGVADLLKPMGFTAGQAAGMSTELINLSGALSAWTGGARSAGEVSDILTKAYLGERDGLKELGISISEADVSRRLAEKGQTDLTGAALEQAKALATQELIFEKSTDAQKAWADGSMDGIKAQNKAKAAVGQLGETVAKGLYPALASLLPVVQRVAQWMADSLPGAMKTAKSVLDGVTGAFGWLRDNMNIVGPVLIGVGAAVLAVVVPAFVGWAVAAGAAAVATIAAAAPFIAIGAAIAAVAAGFVWAYQNVDWFRTSVDAVASFLKNTVWPIVKTVFEGIANAVAVAVRVAGDWIGKLRDTFSAVWGTIRSTVEGAVNAVVGFVTGIAGRVSGSASAAFDTLKSAITGARDWVSGRVENIVGFFSGLPGRLRDALAGLATIITTPYRLAFNGIANLWNNTVGKLSFTVPSWIPGIGGKGWDVPNIPTFHNGGTIMGLRGQEVPILALAGETVRTRAQEQGLQRQLVGSSSNTTIIQQMTVVTNDAPRRFFDEGKWRVA